MKKILLLALPMTAVASEPQFSASPQILAPPPALSPFTVRAFPEAPRLHPAATVYSIGDPTPEEQLHLELINRARANPVAEAARLANITDPQITGDYASIGVDLDLMQSQFTVFSPAQPLAMNAKLTQAARGHSQDMLDNVFQDHNSSDGRTAFARIKAVSYAGVVGENIYANAKSVEHGHAAFEVDWGGSAETGGMQVPPGHRESIHNPLFREVGIGVVIGSNSQPGKVPLDHVGPQLVTEDFGYAQNATPLITGVAYYDLNGNKFYDMGEGIGGVSVSVVGGAYSAVTARSGGYAIPVMTNGTYTVVFSGAGFADISRTVEVVGSKNLKLDFTPAYTAPSVTGPAAPTVGRANTYNILSVPGASAYEWRSFAKVSAQPEGAENGSERLTVTQTGAYDVFQGLLVKSGSFAFHLVTPSNGAGSQYLTLSPSYVLNANSSLQFQSILGFSTEIQHARVQLSTDDGSTWTTVFNQDGSIDNRETSWHSRSVSLGSYAGKIVRLRFAYDAFPVPGMGYVNTTDLNAGWVIDDISFTSAEEIVDVKTTATSSTTINFVPEAVGDFVLQARAKTGHEFLDWGPTLPIHAAVPSGAPVLNLSLSRIAGGQIQIIASVISGATPAQVHLESRATLGDPWQADAITVQPVSATEFRVAITPGANNRSRFYRFRAD